jgi:hypothetical protein
MLPYADFNGNPDVQQNVAANTPPRSPKLGHPLSTAALHPTMG